MRFWSTTKIRDDAGGRFGSGRLLFGVGSTFIAIIIGAACLAIWQLHDQRISDAMTDAQHLGLNLAEETTRTIQAVDLVIRETQAMVAAAGIPDAGQFGDRMGTAEVHSFLLDRLRSLPQANAISLIDNTGRIVNSSRFWPVPDIETADRDFYRYLRDHDDPRSFVGVPVVNKVTGAWVITLTRRISGPRGEFLGIVLGVVEVSFFEDFWASSARAGESVSLLRRDGTLLARYPRVEDMIGKPIAIQSRWYEMVAEGGGTYRTPGYPDGIARIVSVHPIREYPLAVTVALDETVALAPWRTQARLIATGALGVIFGFAVLLRALAIQLRRLSLSESRFRGYALTSSDWFWETDENHRITYISDGIRAFGQDPKIGIGKSRIELAADAGSDSAKWREHLAILDRHEPFRNFVYKRMLGPRSEQTISTSGDPYFDASGRFLGYRGTARDITDLKATESHLRETTEHLDRIQRIAGIGSTTEDLNTREYAWSPRACAIFGINGGDAGKTVEYMRQFYHPADRAKVIEAGEIARRQGAPAPPLEYRIVRPDGAVRWVYRENDVQVDSEGRAISRIVTLKDITDLKEKEMELREAMDHLNRVQRIAGIGSLEVDLTTELEHIRWSQSACELFGVDPACVEPTPKFLLNLIHPDDRAKAKRASDRANRSGTAAPPLEYRIVRPDGSERIVYRENAIQYDESGEPLRRIVTYKDITEIKATEARLRQTQDDLNRAQRLAKVGSDAWDLETGEVTWSDEMFRIFGMDPEQFTPTSENFLDLLVPEDRPKLLARREEILRGKCPPATEFSIRRPDGELRRLYSEAELVLDGNGKPLRWVGMRQDVTEQMLAERSLRDAKEAAEAANVAKSQFLANTSHELRTPLNAIIGFSEMLGRGLAGRLRVKQREYISLIYESGQHLLNVINDILDLAHVDSGKFELHQEDGVDVRQVINSCVSLMRDSANTRELDLATEIEDHLPTLSADPTRLKQILLNLMSNAIKFTEPAGSVVVTGRLDGDGNVVLEVRDSGPGMTPDEIDIALEPFGQVDASHARRHEGTGLGLPLARRLAELHGGSLQVSSRTGVGTTVSVTLPAFRSAAGAAAVERASAA